MLIGDSNKDEFGLIRGRTPKLRNSRISVCVPELVPWSLVAVCNSRDLLEERSVDHLDFPVAAGFLQSYGGGPFDGFRISLEGFGDGEVERKPCGVAHDLA